MAASIQPPDPERFKWERHTAVVGGTGDWSSRDPSASRDGALRERDGAGREMSAWDDSGVQQSFCRAIAAAAAAEDMMVPSSPASFAASLLQQVRVSSLCNSFTLERLWYACMPCLWHHVADESVTVVTFCPAACELKDKGLVRIRGCLRALRIASFDEGRYVPRIL